MINSIVDHKQAERKKTIQRSKQSIFPLFRKLFAVIDVIKVASPVKSALIYVALSESGSQSSTINGFSGMEKSTHTNRAAGFFLRVN